MCKLTFEQTLRQTLANLHIARIVDGDECAMWLDEATAQDIAGIENIIDKLCEDLSKIIGHKIKRITKLTIPSLSGIIGITWEDKANYAFEKLNKAIKPFINCVIEFLRPNHHNTPFNYPINKIRWEKCNVKTKLPNSFNKLIQIKLLEPTKKQCNQEKQPKHIEKILKICEETHFDYQPFILEDNKNKILVLHLGSNWNDLAVATWDKQPFINANKSEAIIVILCFSMMIMMSLIKIENSWLLLLWLIFFVLFGTINVSFISLLILKKFLPLKV